MSSFLQDIKEKKEFLPLFLALLFLYASSYFQRVAIPGTVFNLLQKDFGFNASEISGLSTSFIAVYAFCQLIVGMLADKYGGMRIVLFGGIPFVLGVLLFPLVMGSLPLMYLSRMLVGLGASSMYLSLVRESDRLFGRQNYAAIMGIVYFVGYSGGMFGTLPFAALCKHFDWQTILLVIGIISVVLYGIVILHRKSVPLPPISPEKLNLRTLFGLFRNPYTIVLSCCSAVNFSCYFVIQTVFGMKFLQDFTGMSSSGASAVIFSLTLLTMTTYLFVGFLSRLVHNRRKPFIVFAMGLVLLNTFLIFTAIHFRLPWYVFTAGYLLYAVSSGFNFAFTMSCQEMNARSTQTQAASVINAACYLLVSVAATLIGKLLDSFVDPTAFSAGQIIVYPAAAYHTLFAILLVPVTVSFLLSLLIPETKGHYLHPEPVVRYGR